MKKFSAPHGFKKNVLKNLFARNAVRINIADGNSPEQFFCAGGCSETADTPNIDGNDDDDVVVVVVVVVAR